MGEGVGFIIKAVLKKKVNEYMIMQAVLVPPPPTPRSIYSISSRTMFFSWVSEMSKHRQPHKRFAAFTR